MPLGALGFCSTSAPDNTWKWAFGANFAIYDYFLMISENDMSYFFQSLNTLWNIFSKQSGPHSSWDCGLLNKQLWKQW